MKYFILTSQLYGEEAIEQIYVADSEQDVWNYLHETELEPTNDPVKVEKDKEAYYRKHSLIERKPIIVKQ